jgi:hypothetical protein
MLFKICCKAPYQEDLQGKVKSAPFVLCAKKRLKTVMTLSRFMFPYVACLNSLCPFTPNHMLYATSLPTVTICFNYKICWFNFRFLWHVTLWIQNLDRTDFFKEQNSEKIISVLVFDLISCLEKNQFTPFPKCYMSKKSKVHQRREHW